jgi:hypothetical protein
MVVIRRRTSTSAATRLRRVRPRPGPLLHLASGICLPVPARKVLVDRTLPRRDGRLHLRLAVRSIGRPSKRVFKGRSDRGRSACARRRRVGPLVAFLTRGSSLRVRSVTACDLFGRRVAAWSSHLRAPESHRRCSVCLRRSRLDFLLRTEAGCSCTRSDLCRNCVRQLLQLACRSTRLRVRR